MVGWSKAVVLAYLPWKPVLWRKFWVLEGPRELKVWVENKWAKQSCNTSLAGTQDIWHLTFGYQTKWSLLLPKEIVQPGLLGEKELFRFYIWEDLEVIFFNQRGSKWLETYSLLREMEQFPEKKQYIGLWKHVGRRDTIPNMAYFMKKTLLNLK